MNKRLIGAIGGVTLMGACQPDGSLKGPEDGRVVGGDTGNGEG